MSLSGEIELTVFICLYLAVSMSAGCLGLDYSQWKANQHSLCCLENNSAHLKLDTRGLILLPTHRHLILFEMLQNILPPSSQCRSLVGPV